MFGRVAAALSTKASLSNLGPLNHVAIVTPNLARSSLFYQTCLGAKVSDPVDLPEHGVTTVFVDVGNTKLELLHPLGANSPISGFLKKNPSGGIHHICIEVDDIHQARKVMAENKVRALDTEPKVIVYFSFKIGAHGKLVSFFHPKDLDGVLVIYI
jgi:methylmalonyl-CoA/ethylmalonyl-CoA epimerase